MRCAISFDTLRMTKTQAKRREGACSFRFYIDNAYIKPANPPRFRIFAKTPPFNKWGKGL